MSVTSPTKVWRQRGTRRSDPLSFGSSIFRKVLQYSVVYGRVAMSTLSLSSSSSMIAVFLASLIFRRPSSPVVMVWTFEHPSLRANFSC